MKRKFMAVLLVAILFATITVSAYSSYFSLGGFLNGSHKTNLWYFEEGTATFGYRDFKGGEASINLYKVRRLAPDLHVEGFTAIPSIPTDSATVNVTNANAYYVKVKQISNYPKGEVYCDQ